MTTLADVIRPAFARGGGVAARSALAGTTRVGAMPWPRARVVLYDLALIALGSALIALSARVAIPIPFSPVPVTGQTFAVLLVGALLGRWRGGAAALAYLGEGAAGLPVFAGGAAGPHVLVGPTGGYLVGFVAGAWICGALAERGWDRRVGWTVLAMILGNVAILVPGLAWIARFVGADRALALGLWPFIPGDCVKIALAAALLPISWKWIGDRTL
jgi:biotin transport system substrate-specific component